MSAGPHPADDTSGRILAESNGAGATTREYFWIEVDAPTTSEVAVSAGDAAGSASTGNRLGKAESDTDPFSMAQLPSLQSPKPFDQTKQAMPLAVVEGVTTGSPTLYYVHPDHLYRPVMMTSASKANVWSAVYKPFGEVHSVTGTATMNLRFPGQLYQLETGLHYNWHRSYDPTTGRYNQPDLLAFVSGGSLYEYVTSAPTIFSDITGLAPKDKWYGYTDRRFQAWCHRKVKESGDSDFTAAELKELFEEWLALGQPGPDTKGRFRGKKAY